MSGISTRFPYARLLVVDDSEFERMLIVTALKKAGFVSIMQADDGVKALAKTRDFCPDLVLLDLSMPNLDGFGYCAEVRKDTSLPKMPIIVQTALEDRDSRLRALSCGADDFLTKPLDMDELALRICVHVDRYFMFRDMAAMYGYLKMELDAVRGIHPDVAGIEMPPARKRDFENHCEVLEQLAHLSAP